MKAFIFDRLESNLGLEGFSFRTRRVEARSLAANEIKAFDDPLRRSVCLHGHTPL